MSPAFAGTTTECFLAPQPSRKELEAMVKGAIGVMCRT